METKEKKYKESMMLEEKYRNLISDMSNDNIYLRNINTDIYNELIKGYMKNRNLASSILSSRYNNIEEVIEYFNFNINSVFDINYLSGLIDVAVGVDILDDAIRQNKKIVLLTDYDCDGIVAGAVFYRILKEILNYDNFRVLVNKREHGYGLNSTITEKIIDMYNNGEVDLLITADCGTNNYDKINTLASMGLKIIVTDHHQINSMVDAKSMQCVLINPQRDDTLYFKSITGATVLYFMLLYYIIKNGYLDNEVRNYMLDIMSMIGITILSDSASLLCPLNKKLLKIGIEKINNDVCRIPTWMILKKILNVEYIDNITLTHSIIPLINSTGRISDPAHGFELLIENDLDRMEKKINEIKEINEFRKKLQHETLTTEEKTEYKNDKVLVALVDFAQGIQGTVASNIIKNENYPVVFYFSRTDESNNILIGSGRAREDLDINLNDVCNNIAKDSDIIISYGGHKKAIGIKIKNSLKEFFDLVTKHLRDSDFNRSEHIEVDDVIVSNKKLLSAALDVLEIGPYGTNFHLPLFCSDIYIIAYRIFNKNSAKYMNAKIKLFEDSKLSINIFYSITKKDIEEHNILEKLKYTKRARIVYAINTDTYLSTNKILLSVVKFIPKLD